MAGRVTWGQPVERRRGHGCLERTASGPERAFTAQNPSGSTGSCRPAVLPWLPWLPCGCRAAFGLRQGCPCCALSSPGGLLRTRLPAHLGPVLPPTHRRPRRHRADLRGALRAAANPKPNPNPDPNPNQVMKYKNMPAEEVLAVLRAEAAASCEE